MKKGTVSVVSTLAGTIIGAIGTAIVERKVLGKTDYQQLANKHLAIMKLYDQWMQTKQEGKNVADFFHANNINSIAIYGMSFLGQRLYEELKETDIKVLYGIDKNAAGIYSDIDIITPDDSLPQADAIVVTAIYFFNEIEDTLEKKTNIKVLSFEDILFEL